MLMDEINVVDLISRKISLFGKMQRGRSPFELFQIDMYEKGGAYCFAHVGRSVCRYPLTLCN